MTPSSKPRESSVAVQPYRVTAECPHCFGELRFTGNISYRTSGIEVYEHICEDEYAYEHDVNGKPRMFYYYDEYPRIDYKEL